MVLVSLGLLLALGAPARHLAVAPADTEAVAGELEWAVRDALRSALPGDSVQTYEDAAREAMAGVDAAAATADDAARTAQLACAFGQDGLITTQRLELRARSHLKLCLYQQGNVVPRAEITVPLDGAAAAARAAVRLLLAHL